MLDVNFNKLFICSPASFTLFLLGKRQACHSGFVGFVAVFFLLNRINFLKYSIGARFSPFYHTVTHIKQEYQSAVQASLCVFFSLFNVCSDMITQA